MNIYITQNDEKKGPYSLPQAQRLIASGAAQPTDWAWYEGLPNWIPLSQIPGMIPGAARAPAERPVMVWIISLFYFVTTPLSLVGLAAGPLMLKGNFPMQPAQHAYFDSLGIIDYGLSGLGILINLVAAILLFRLKRSAFYVFLGAFVFGLCVIAYNIFAKNWLAAVGIPGALGGLFGYAISIAILVYVGYLFRKGVLR